MTFIYQLEDLKNPNKMEKSALNILLDWCKEFDETNNKPTHTNMKEKIWQLLELEKKQMIDFHEAGQSIFSDTTFTHEAKQYYTNKYNK